MLSSFSAGGHGGLVFRSGKDGDHSTRLNCVFVDVAALETRCWFSGLVVEEVDRRYLSRFASKPIEMLEPGVRVFRVSSPGAWEGYVLASGFLICEDEKNVMEPMDVLWPPEENQDVPRNS